MDLSEKLRREYTSAAFEVPGVQFLLYNDRESVNIRTLSDLPKWSESALKDARIKAAVSANYLHYKRAIDNEVESSLKNSRIKTTVSDSYMPYKPAIDQGVEIALASEVRSSDEVACAYVSAIKKVLPAIVGKTFFAGGSSDEIQERLAQHNDDIKVVLINRIIDYCVEATIFEDVIIKSPQRQG